MWTFLCTSYSTQSLRQTYSSSRCTWFTKNFPSLVVSSICLIGIIPNPTLIFSFLILYHWVLLSIQLVCLISMACSWLMFEEQKPWFTPICYVLCTLQELKAISCSHVCEHVKTTSVSFICHIPFTNECCMFLLCLLFTCYRWCVS
jgi:hypothetical protein